MFGSSPIFTNHAKKRGKSRGIGASSATRATHGSKKYLGKGKYKATSGGVTTVFKRKGGKKIILTSWKQR
jgi:hypothetical protein